MSKTVCFPQLNHTNYAEWALRMEAILIRIGFWDLVTGDEKLEGADDKKAFRRREAQCRAEIILRVEDSQLPYIFVYPVESYKLCRMGFAHGSHLNSHWILGPCHW